MRESGKPVTVVSVRFNAVREIRRFVDLHFGFAELADIGVRAVAVLIRETYAFGIGLLVT